MKRVWGDEMSTKNFLNDFSNGSEKSHHPVDEVLGIIQRLRGGEADRMSWKDLCEKINYLMTGLVLPGHEGANSNGGIYRARRITGKPFQFVKDLGFRPPKDCNDYGRCHSPGKPAFYGSLNLMAMLAEVRAEKGDLYQVIEANFLPGNNLRITEIGQITHYIRWGHTVFHNSENKRFLDEILHGRDNPSERQKYWMLMDAFISECFWSRDYDARLYRITSAVCNLLFEGGSDIIVYPSVAFGGGLNVAIKPEVFSKNMETKNCALMRVTENLGFNIYSFIIEKECEKIDKGQFIWGSK